MTGAATFAGSAVQMTDTFTGTNGTALSAHTADTGQTWGPMHDVSWSGGLALNGSNHVTSSTIGAYQASLTPSSPDYTASVPMNVSTSGSGWGMILARLNGVTNSTFSGYGCRFAEGVGTLLEVWVAGVNTQNRIY